MNSVSIIQLPSNQSHPQIKNEWLKLPYASGFQSPGGGPLILLALSSASQMAGGGRPSPTAMPQCDSPTWEFHIQEMSSLWGSHAAMFWVLGGPRTFMLLREIYHTVCPKIRPQPCDIPSVMTSLPKQSYTLDFSGLRLVSLWLNLPTQKLYCS